MEERKNMVIHFIDDSKVSFDFPQQVKDPMLLIRHMEKALNQPYIAVESEGAVLLYPRDNIKSIQIYPAPEKMSDFVIRGAESANYY